MAARLQRLAEELSRAEPFEATVLEQLFRAWVEAQGIAMKEVAQPARVALTGRAASPPLFDVMAVLGKEQCRQRLMRAADIAESTGAGG